MLLCQSAFWYFLDFSRLDKLYFLNSILLPRAANFLDLNAVVEVFELDFFFLILLVAFKIFQKISEHLALKLALPILVLIQYFF